jgi:hypothetical protein
LEEGVVLLGTPVNRVIPRSPMAPQGHGLPGRPSRGYAPIRYYLRGILEGTLMMVVMLKEVVSEDSCGRLLLRCCRRRINILLWRGSP